MATCPTRWPACTRRSATPSAAGMAAARAGVTGEDVHRATIAAIVQHGYKTGLPPADAPDDYCAMTHGTGHGVGLDCHEPPLLDFKGPELLEGELVTIEPGLYRRGIGGVRGRGHRPHPRGPLRDSQQASGRAGLGITQRLRQKDGRPDVHEVVFLSRPLRSSGLHPIGGCGQNGSND